MLIGPPSRLAITWEITLWLRDGFVGRFGAGGFLEYRVSRESFFASSWLAGAGNASHGVRAELENPISP